jgi:hypothetical protein
VLRTSVPYLLRWLRREPDAAREYITLALTAADGERRAEAARREADNADGAGTITRQMGRNVE